MMKRLTAKEVVKNFEATAVGMAFIDMNNAAGMYRDAARFVDQHLVPRWQDEPDADGWYWVDGVKFPAFVHRTDPDDVEDNGEWSVTGWDADGMGEDYRSLNSRRVCPIGERPEDVA